MRILIDNNDDMNRLYMLPWSKDSTCFNFKAPERHFFPDKISEIKRPSFVETLVIACDLDDYSFISRMKNLTQLYIYSGNNLFELSFLEHLVKLNQLCIMNSHVKSLDSLKKLIEKKYELYDSAPQKEKTKAQFAYEFEGICIETDAYDSDGTELLRKNIVRDDVRVNHHIISYSETIRNKRLAMLSGHKKNKPQK